jgi:phosphate-selective porin OprO/OprP
MKKIFYLTLLIWITAFTQGHAQHTDLVDSTQTNLLLDTNKKYAVPDVKKMSWTNFSTKLFSMQIGAVPIIDYTAFFQNGKSVSQVGDQNSQFDIRSARLMFRGKIFFKNPWSYLISVEYKGIDRTPDQNAFGFTDLMFTIPAGKIGSFSVGKLKETFVYEMVGDAANLPQTERILNPFFISRNTGVRWNKTLLNDRMTVAAGYFNNFASTDTTIKGGANEFTARVTGLVYNDEADKKFLHLGVSYRYLEAKDGVLRYKGKDESNVSSNYVDTKDFAANHSASYGFEELYNVKNFSLLGEYVISVASTPQGNENFKGYYLTGSWVLSGEQRPYDKKAAYARRVKPSGKSGAWEIVARVSKVDLDSRDIKGGKLFKLYGGLNWWATQRWRISTGYGYGNLDKDNIKDGITNSVITRLQWVY